jgi:branched-chain amino acid transport system permease protein
MKTEFADVSGIKLCYRTEGEGKPLVYVHGNTGSSLWFSKVMKVPGCRTYALDLPNFGNSDPLEGAVDLRRYADHLKGFIDALGLGSPLVAAHSLGGAVAQSMAISSPESLCGLVLIDSAAPRGLVTPRERHPLIEMMRKDRSFLSKALAATLPTLKDPAFFEALVDDALRMAEPAWIGNAEALSRFDISERAAEFAKPVLVLWGRSDCIVTEAMARETAAAYPKGELKILEGVGHSVIAEDPARFMDLLMDFIAKL